MNDISIIALAKVLALPVVSMETLIRQPEAKWRRIPNVCLAENVEHLSFNDFLRRENVRLRAPVEVQSSFAPAWPVRSSDGGGAA